MDRELHAQRLIDSYRRCTGKELFPVDGERPLAEQLYEAPVVVLSHGTEADPVLNYGNRTALELWEMDEASFTKMPSRYTAEPMEREARERFMAAVRANGYVDDYTGIRISSTGRRFQIQRATVWNVVDERGERIGQAAAFSGYEYV